MNGLVAGLVVLLVIVAGGAGVVLYQLMRQQGRMLLRIDELERTLGRAPGARANHIPVGPPVGSAVDPFIFSDLDGGELGLSDFAGNKVLLVNWSASCGYCDRIAPDLQALRLDLEGRKIALALLSRGDANANRANADKHGLASSVYLLGPEANPAGFQGLGTPAAILLDEEGKVASPLVVGADKVPRLAQELARAAATGNRKKKLRGERPISDSSLIRDGLKAGTPAPAFTLPDLGGNPVSLADFLGERVLLTFSDPDCGPCEALAPHLVRIQEERRRNNLTVVFVGRGEIEENRRKAEQHGFTFPVVVQTGWNLSRTYGIFATPVAFLIDEKGIIVHDVARGVDEIGALVPSALDR